MLLEDNLIKQDKHVTSGAKDNLVSECTNTGLISALMLTIVMPMSFDSVADWLEEDYVGSGFAFLDGYIGQQLSASQLENALPALNDISMVFYVLGVFGFLASTVLTVVMLLCVGEVSSDKGCQEFMRRVGHGTRGPYLLFMSGCFFAIPASIRYAAGIKTLAGLVLLFLVGCIMVFIIIAVSYWYVQACIRTHNRINEFSDLHLSQEEAQEDVEAWFRQTPKGGTLEDCLQDLAGVLENKDSSQLIIGLDGISTQRVAMHYHKKNAETIGLSLSQSELYQLARQ